jgi:hypothetical protein
MRHRRGIALRRRYGRATHPLFPRIHIVVSRDVTAYRAEAGDKFAIEARLQKHYGADWALVGLRYAKTAGEARSLARTMATSLAAEYKPGSPVDISHGSRAFGEVA